MKFQLILFIVVSAHFFTQGTLFVEAQSSAKEKAAESLKVSTSLKVIVVDQNGALVGKAKAFLIRDKLVSPAKASVSSSKKDKTIVHEVSSVSDKSVSSLKEGKSILMDKASSAAGEVFFSKLAEGSYQLKVKAIGFVPFEKTVLLKHGENLEKVILKVANITETVEVELSAREKRFESIVARDFTPEEINKLPSNPAGIEKELRRKFGAGALIRIDGFEGGKFPDKSQIASIKVIRNALDAEFHHFGDPVIEIKTRAGSTNSSWSGSTSVLFASSALNARNAFVAKKLPFNTRNVSFDLAPPSIGKNTSLYFSFSSDEGKSSREFIGITPFNVLEDDLPTRSKSFFPTVRLTQNLSEYHTLYGEYSYYNQKQTGLGLGWFDLPERAYSSDTLEHTFKLSEHGIIKNKFINELRFLYSSLNQETNPVADDPPIIVLDAFNAGGAGLESKEKHQTLKLINILSFGHGKHAIKLGGEFEYEKSDVVSQINKNGSFTFSSLEDYEWGLPLLFIKQEGEGKVKASNFKTALFFQDDIRLSRYFQIGLGVRYEYQGYRIKDYNNFAPRISFVWSPEKTGRLTIRGGFGTGYEWLERNDLLHILRNNGKNSSELIIQYPNFPNPYGEGWKEPSSITQLDKNLKSPETHAAFLAINYEPSSNLHLQVWYIAAKLSHQFRSRDINAPFSKSESRPDPLKGRITSMESTGKGSGHLGTLTVEAEIKGIPLEVKYAFSKDLTDFEGIFDLPSDSYNLRADWGARSGEASHVINVNTSFDFFTALKLLYPKLNRLKQLKNITASFNFNASSGLPYTIITGRDDNGDAVINDRPAGVQRNSERENWTSSTDASFNWSLPSPANGKVRGMTLSVNFFNLFNQTNKRGYVGVQTSPFFGQPTYSDPARNITLGLYISF